MIFIWTLPGDGVKMVGGFLHEMALRTPRVGGGLRSRSAPLLSSVAGGRLDGTGFMGRKPATARRAHYACVLVKVGDTANWTVGRTNSGFRQTRLINLRLGTYVRLDGRSCAT
jgi:hypothetical protein